MKAHLESLVALLDKVTAGANQAHEATQRLNTSTQQSVSTLTSVSSVLSSVSVQATQTAQTVHTTLTDLQRSADQTHAQVATRLDDMLSEVAGSKTGLAAHLRELISAVQLGALSINDLLVAFGDALFQGKTVRDQLKDIPFDLYTDRMENLVRALRAGGVEIDEVLKFLGESQLSFAKKLSQIIELFQQGRVTLKRVADLVGEIQRQYPNSEFSDLAEALYNALRRS